MKYRDNKGFTLVEVLIAAVILFSALSITAELYNSSSLIANKVIDNSRLAQASSIAIQSIKADLRLLSEQRGLSEHSGNVLVMGINFQWTANREKFSSRAIELSDIEPPRNQFSIFLVNVVPTLNERNYQSFSFKVITW